MLGLTRRLLIILMLLMLLMFLMRGLLGHLHRGRLRVPVHVLGWRLLRGGLLGLKRQRRRGRRGYGGARR